MHRRERPYKVWISSMYRSEEGQYYAVVLADRLASRHRCWGYGLDAGELVPIPPFTDVSEAVVNYLNAIGLRVKMRTMERAAFLSTWREKKLRGLFITAVGASGNAATRIEAFIYSKGPYAYGGYPDIDELFQQQARERDRAKREAVLHRIQQLTVEREMFAPIMDLRALLGVGPRLADHTINSIPLHPGPAVEDIRLREP
jgi:peptide/nickel transport system substrate-binding protein